MSKTERDTLYPQVVRAVANSPWAILPEKLATIRELIAYRAEGHRFTDEEIQARIGAAPPQQQTVTQGAVAILPLFGVMAPRASLMTDISGGTSVEAFSAMFAQAVADQQVDAILIHIDSPGGMTDLVPELAAQIRESRGSKPIVAIANTDAASAAYWVAAQADELVVTPSGMVGSIGVFAAHDDISAMQEKLGVKTTLISAGKFKVEMSPFEPLSDEARAAIQDRVDAFYGMFVADVAKGRGVTEAAVRGGFGEGRVVTAEAALKARMVDRVDTFDSTLARLAHLAGSRGNATAAFGYATSKADARAGLVLRAAGQPAPPDDPGAATSGLSFTDEAEALHVSAERFVNRAASLAEVERGHLTVSKRERLTACTEGLRATVTTLDELLAATDPDKHANAVLRERARYERQRANL